MGIFFSAGETKTRPNVYQRYEKTGDNASSSAIVGVLAVPVQAEWGPLGKVTVHESSNSIRNTYGESLTVDAALETFKGGAIKVYCYRLGTGGKKASVDLKSDSGTASATVTALYEGTKDIRVSVRAKSVTGDGDDPTIETKELIVYNGTAKAETYEFAAGDDEISALVDAVKNSEYITVAAKSTGVTDKTIAIVASTSLTGGQNPTTTNADYSSALNAFEPYDFNMVCLDTVDSNVQAILIEWLNRVYETGKLCFAAYGTSNSTETLDNICTNAKALNNEKALYFGDYGYEADGTLVDGYQFVNRCAGVAASTPTNESIVHNPIPGIATIVPRTNTEYETAIKAGVIMCSYSPNDVVWFDSGVTTLTTPSDNQDSGWKKYRRVATRFELMRRIDNVTAPLIGKINCDNDGVATVIQYGQGVLNDMIQERKLEAGATIIEDPERPHAGDSAWFKITADDIDSMEKIYLTYQFRYSSNS